MNKQHFAVPVWLCHKRVRVHKQNVCIRAYVAYSTVHVPYIHSVASSMIILEHVFCIALYREVFLLAYSH